MHTDVRIAALPGDGIGPEVYTSARQLFDTANALGGHRLFDVTELPYNADWYLTHGSPWPKETPQQLMENFRALFLIAFGDPRVPQRGMAHAHEIVLNTGRILFETNLNKRPYFLVHPSLRPSVQHGPLSFDLVEIHPDSQGISERVVFGGASAEHVVVEETQKMTGFHDALQRGFERARRKGERAIVVVEKGNVLQHTHGQWGAIAEECAQKSGIQVQMHLMDSFVERLVRAPTSIPSTVVADETFASMLRKPFALLRELRREKIPEVLDGVVARENTEGMYIREGSTVGAGIHGVGVQRGRHTRLMIEENLKGAFALAAERGLDEITIISLPETHPRTTALWRTVGRELASKMNTKVSSISAGDFICNALFNPTRLHNQVFAADNLLGDICGDAAAGLVGGLGMPPTNSYNTTGRTGKYFFEPLHGSAPDIAGKGIANPTATMLTVGEVFSSFGRCDLQRALHQALFDTFDSGIKTPDCGGSASTEQFSQAVLERFSRLVG